MQKYVCGFLFDRQDNVVLIRKTKPLWQKGLLNGVGGKVEEGESNLEAMIREFKEEAGVNVPYWRPLCELHGEDWVVYFYQSLSGDEVLEDISFFNEMKNDGDEKIEIVSIKNINDSKTIPNIKWLIPMCCDMNHKYARIESY